MDPYTTEGRTLINKLCSVMAEAGYVAKRGHNDKFDYDYATEADVVNGLRDKLAAAKVFVFPSVVSTERKPHSKTSSGADMHITDILVRWTFVDGESGEQFECFMPGCGTDMGDKGIYKAITGSSKYLFLKAFMLPTGDDPEKDGDEPAGSREAQREVAASKLRDAVTGEEIVTFTTEGGVTYLGGAGLSIVRASLTPEELGRFQLRAEGSKWMIDTVMAFHLVDACKKYNVGTVWMDAPNPVKSSADIKPMEGAGSVKTVAVGPALKYIKSAKEKTGTRMKDGKKIEWALLEVVYGDARYVCWDKKLWPLLVISQGKPATLSTVPSFDAKKDATIDGIIEIEGVYYEQVGDKIVAIVQRD